MSTYRAFEATGAHNLQLVERELLDPAPGQVRLRVEACGVCHTDVLAVEGLRSDPRAPSFRGMRSSASLTPSGPASPPGSPVTASASAS